MNKEFNAEKAAAEFNEIQAEEQLNQKKTEAEEMLKDIDKTEEFLQDLEMNLKGFPVAGDALASVPTLIALIRNHIKGEYTKTSWASIVLTLSSLIYLLCPIDAIPDLIPVVGFVDDVTVLGFCMKCIKTELDKYVTWRNESGLTTHKEETKAAGATSFFG